MTKEEKIQEAYSENWEIVKDYVDKNGWSQKRSLIKGFDIKDFDSIAIKTMNFNYEYRPKSLQGIENNNGWIKIESENDLPKNEIEYFVKRKNVAGIFIRQFVISHTNSWLKCYTHYQPIQKPQPPIY